MTICYLQKEGDWLLAYPPSKHFRAIAEGGGFEPPKRSPVYRFSRPARSSTLPSFQSSYIATADSIIRKHGRVL